jgi:hypothetical protein
MIRIYPQVSADALVLVRRSDIFTFFEFQNSLKDLASK